MKPLEEHPERGGSAAQAPAGPGASGHPLPPTTALGAARLPGMGILAEHPGADPPAGPGRAGAAAPVAPAHRPAGTGGCSCHPLGPTWCFGRCCTCSSSCGYPMAARDGPGGAQPQPWRGGSIPPAKLKPQPAPSPAPPPLQKFPHRGFFFGGGFIFFFSSLLKTASRTSRQQSLPSAEQPPRRERTHSCKLPCGWKAFAVLLRCVFGWFFFKPEEE